MTHLRASWAALTRTGAFQVAPRSPLAYDRYRVNERIAWVEGTSYAPQVQGARERMEAAYKTWRATNPGRRRPERFTRPDAWVPPGFNYFTPENSAPGTVAFIDLEVMSNTVRIAYMDVRPDRRGQGLARKLIQETYDRHPTSIIHWGRLMQPEMGHLYDSFLEAEPERTMGGHRNY